MKQRALVYLALMLAGVALVNGQAAQRSVQNPPQAQTPKATITGTVTRADNGQPIKGVTVMLQNSARTQGALTAGLPVAEAPVFFNLASSLATVTTDENGRFTFTGIDPGQYLISAERSGYTRAEHGQRTATGSGVATPVSANQQLNIDLKMLQASVISGRVINTEGEPAAQATVQAHTYTYSNGQRTLAEVTSAQTNDLGEYRLYWLAPGEYFVSVTTDTDDSAAVGTVDVSQARGARAGNAARAVVRELAVSASTNVVARALGGDANPPVFYPGIVDPDGAIPVAVPASVEVRGVDFHLRPIRTATVSGRVVAPFPLNQGNNNIGLRGRGANGPDGAPFQFALATAPVQLSLNRLGNARTGLGGLLNLRLGATPVNADGSFEIKGVAPGEYNLTATARDQNGQQLTGRTRINVGSSDVPNLTVTVKVGTEIRGRVILDGTAPSQFSMSNLRVSLVAEDSAMPGLVNFVSVAGARGDAIRTFLPGAQSQMTEVAADGSFTLRDVGAMEYRIRVIGLPQGAYLQSGRIDSADALNAPFTVDNPGTQLQLQIGFTPGRVSGTIADDRGAAAAGVQAVLVPDETRRGRSDAYFAATTDQNGQFAFTNVPPGRYKLFAWEEIPAGAYQYPDFIRRYEERGQSITVNANGAITEDARLIPANQ